MNASRRYIFKADCIPLKRSNTSTPNHITSIMNYYSRRGPVTSYNPWVISNLTGAVNTDLFLDYKEEILPYL